MLSPPEVRAYKRKLKALLGHFRGEVTELRSETGQFTGEGDAKGTTTLVIPHDEESGLSGKELDFVLLRHEENLLAECEAALGRIESGSYGFCEDCRQPIPRERLKVLPYVRYCLACAGLREAESER